MISALRLLQPGSSIMSLKVFSLSYAYASDPLFSCDVEHWGDVIELSSKPLHRRDPVSLRVRDTMFPTVLYQEVVQFFRS